MMDNMFLTEIIATRLSHDLIGNIGAVSNAVELLKEGDENDLDDVNNILEFSSSVLAKRLKFFRLCFGMSNASVKDLDELKKIVSEYLETIGNPNYKIAYKQDISTQKIYKFIMPSVMMMADVIIKGGEIVVKQTDNALMIEVNSSEKLNISKLEDIKKILNNQEVNENISSFAPLYYLLAYTNKAKANVFLDGSTLVIGE